MIDSHCHLGIGHEWKEPGQTPEVLLKRAQDAGVSGILTVACSYKDEDDLKQMLEYPNVWGAFGIHPENAPHFDLTHSVRMLTTFSNLVALGEIGLDYYYEPETRAQQIKVFEAQIELAARYRLPIIIHTRDAEDDTIKILRAAKEGGLLENSGVLHCFTGTRLLAESAMEMGLYISASGIITFKKAAELRGVFADVPLNKLLVETDSPYLAPVPYRGKLNEPSYVIETAKELARIKEVTFDEINKVTTGNFKKLFCIKGE